MRAGRHLKSTLLDASYIGGITARQGFKFQSTFPFYSYLPFVSVMHLVLPTVPAHLDIHLPNSPGLSCPRSLALHPRQGILRLSRRTGTYGFLLLPLPIPSSSFRRIFTIHFLPRQFFEYQPRRTGCPISPKWSISFPCPVSQQPIQNYWSPLSLTVPRCVEPYGIPVHVFKHGIGCLAG